MGEGHYLDDPETHYLAADDLGQLGLSISFNGGIAEIRINAPVAQAETAIDFTRDFFRRLRHHHHDKPHCPPKPGATHLEFSQGKPQPKG